MVVTVLKMTIAVEPDLQRFAAFILDAVATLGGNLFDATSRLDALLGQVRADGLAADRLSTVEIRWSPPRLTVDWNDVSVLLALIEQPCPDELVAQLSERLANASESASPALLMQRNSEIRRQLELARIEAAREMADLEGTLERKKHDLEEMAHKAETDALTGLYNRRAYEEQLEKVVREEIIPCTLALFDLDHFKEINDSAGHLYGDTYLRRMGGALQGAIRKREDLAFRIGGDEFAVFVFADQDAGARLGNKVLAAMDGRVSIGVAARLRGEDARSWVGRADAALYVAKETGRGRVAVAPAVSVAARTLS